MNTNYRLNSVLLKELGAFSIKFLFLFIVTLNVVAEETVDSQSKRIQIPRVKTAPLLDGVVNEGEWSKAAVLGENHQVVPFEYEPATEKTKTYIMYDKDALYVGMVAYDGEPEKITAKILKQGSDLIADDRVGILLDPLNDKASGYLFELNPNGVRLEGLYETPTRFSGTEWDGIWHGASAYNENGYSTEFAIPFKTLSFNPDNDAWGFNAFRVVVRKEEKIAWVSYNHAFNPASSGEIYGLYDMDIGKGLDVVPSMSMRRTRDFQTDDVDYKLEPSLDVFYRLTEGLNASLTINTDFSATEVDDRQVNLTRFNLFFPEKRDFFLKDNEIFQFGNISADIDNLSTTASADLENARPFFSRTIGLDGSGNPVDIDIGGKLSGRIGSWNVGGLVVRQAATNELDASDLFVARVSRKVLAESSIGAIMTYGDPNSNNDNHLFGVDFRYLNTDIPGGNTLVGEAWIQKTETTGLEGDDMAWGVGLRLPNNTGWRARAVHRTIQENFKPAMGFVSRIGVRDNALELGYTHRPLDNWIRDIYTGVDLKHISRIDDGSTQTQNLRIRLAELRNHHGDTVKFRYDLNKEGLAESFEILPGIILPAASYHFNRYGFYLETSKARSLSLSGWYFDGSYFNGERDYYEASLTWRPNKHIGLTGGMVYNKIELEQGDFTARLVNFQADLVFNNRLSWSNLVQFDNVSNNLLLNSRLHWAPESGQDVILVFNYNLTDTEDEGFVSVAADLTLKASYTFRF